MKALQKPSKMTMKAKQNRYQSVLHGNIINLGDKLSRLEKLAGPAAETLPLGLEPPMLSTDLLELEDFSAYRLCGSSYAHCGPQNQGQ